MSGDPSDLLPVGGAGGAGVAIALAVALISTTSLAQNIYVYDEGTQKGRPTGLNFKGSGVTASCFNDGGLNQRCDVDVSGGGGSGVMPSGLCGASGTALGWDGGAYYCADEVKAGSCSAGQFVTAISNSGVPTCQSGGTTAGWLSATLSARQSTNLGKRDHIKFDTVLDSSGSLVTLDTSTAYTNGDGVASIGRLTLTSGHSYRLQYLVHAVSQVDFSIMGFANADTGAPIGPAGVINNAQYHPPIEAIFTPASNTRVEVRVYNNGGSINWVGSKCSDDSNVCQLDGGNLTVFPSLTVLVLN
jgi:hypothetical protein